MGIVVSDIMRFRRWITLLSVLMVLTVSVIAFSTSPTITSVMKNTYFTMKLQQRVMRAVLGET